VKLNDGRGGDRQKEHTGVPAALLEQLPPTSTGSAGMIFNPRLNRGRNCWPRSVWL